MGETLWAVHLFSSCPSQAERFLREEVIERNLVKKLSLKNRITVGGKEARNSKRMYNQTSANSESWGQKGETDKGERAFAVSFIFFQVDVC